MFWVFNDELNYFRRSKWTVFSVIIKTKKIKCWHNSRIRRQFRDRTLAIVTFRDWNSSIIIPTYNIITSVIWFIYIRDFDIWNIRYPQQICVIKCQKKNVCLFFFQKWTKNFLFIQFIIYIYKTCIIRNSVHTILKRKQPKRNFFI